jgi:hypothetical protein
MSASSKLISAASAAVVAYLGWRSLGWPLVHDAPLMHYVAWLLNQGGVPYRDAFDMNVPGVYALHSAVLLTAGSGDLAWRLFDLLWLALTAGLLAACVRPFGAWPAAGAALLFALYHLSGGAWRAGQRDFLLCAFLLGGALLASNAVERGLAPRRLLVAGVCLGAAVTVKPHAALYWLACMAVAAWGARQAGRSALTAASVVFTGGLLAPLLAVAWLDSRGALTPFLAIVGDYLVPLYGRVGRASPATALGWYRFGWVTWALLLAIGVLACAAPLARRLDGRRALLVLGALYGVVHFVLQGKGWEYHLYPLAAFLIALLPVALHAARSRVAVPAARAAGGPARARLAAGLALAAWVTLVVLLGVKGVAALDEGWTSRKAARVDAIARDLARLVPPRGTVQVMDTTSGGIHALLRLGLRQPTRFIYDFHFFHDEADPRIRRLRAELVEGLAARPPAAVVVLEDDWIRPGYARLDGFPEMARWLADGYTLAAEGDGYRIYAKRRGA